MSHSKKPVSIGGESKDVSAAAGNASASVCSAGASGSSSSSSGAAATSNPKQKDDKVAAVDEFYAEVNLLGQSLCRYCFIL